MTDGDGKNFKMAFEDWDIIGQGTSSLTTITAVVKKAEGDKYVTSSLVLSFIHTCMKSLAEDRSIKQPWFGPGNPRREFPVSSVHESSTASHISIRQDLEDRWVTNMNDDRKRFYLIASLLDPRTKFLSFCATNTYSSPHRGNMRVTLFLQWSLKAFTVRFRILR